MGLSERLPKERWRRLGILNVSVICSSGVLMLVALISATATRPASTMTEARILFRGKCSTSDGLELFLQLIINIFSTCILASSNFFMQVVSSPTRKEIDHAHQSLHSLEIGVSSFKNLGALSWFKIIAWAGLFLSSVPIHLFFNSAIFSTDYEGSDWHLTIASSDFVNQTIDYFVPGASLAPAGTSCPASPNGTDSGCSYSDVYIDAGSSAGGILIHPGSSGYGRNNASMANMGITKAAQNSSSWELLTPSECFDQYRFCKPKQKYRDLVVVVHEIPGWVRSEVFNFSGSAASNLSQFWNARVPANQLNSLWYSTPCRAWRYGNSWEVRLPKICSSSQPGYGLSSSLSPPTGCSGALGEPSGVDWINTTKLRDSWRIPFRPPGMSIPPSFGYNVDFNELAVNHCMVEPNPEFACKVGIAPPLLFIVIGCVFLKGCICIAVLLKLTHESLVTPGDAIASFISQPDPNTAGLATMSFADADRLEYKSLVELPISGLSSGPRARKWKPRSHRFKSVLPKAVWTWTYSMLLGGMMLLATGLGSIVTSSGGSAL